VDVLKENDAFKNAYGKKILNGFTAKRRSRFRFSFSCIGSTSAELQQIVRSKENQAPKSAGKSELITEPSKEGFFLRFISKKKVTTVITHLPSFG
jgi:hypothetical protein